MAPRPLESQLAFFGRLERAAAQGQREVRFGGHHFTHAVCREDDAWRVRRLEFTQAEAAAYLARHGHFTPENAEDLGQPRTVVLEARSLDELVERLKAEPWPLPLRPPAG